jgi:hypothetical protein
MALREEFRLRVFENKVPRRIFRPKRDEGTGERRRLLKLLNSTGYVMHHQFNIRQLYVLPTLYLCVLYLSEKKQRLVPLNCATYRIN